MIIGLLSIFSLLFHMGRFDKVTDFRIIGRIFSFTNLQIMWLLSFLFGDPSAKKLKQYQKELDIIKSIEIKFREEITTIDQVQAKTHEFQSKFQGLDIESDTDKQKIREILESIKHEAFALHRRACELIY